MSNSRNAERLEEAVADLQRVRKKAEQVAQDAPQEEQEAQSAIDHVEKRRQESHEEVDRIHDQRRTPYEAQKQQAQKARRRAERISPFLAFLDGEIGIFTMLYRLTFR